MNKEDKKLRKHLVDEMMKVSQTNPDVMYYMEVLMKNYEKLQQELDKYKNIVDELEKYIEKHFIGTITTNILNKLKELKGE